MPTAAQLTLTDVTKRYDDRVILDRVSLTVRPGEKVGVIGDNGAGKSTLLRLLAGVEHPDNGTVLVRAPGGVGYLPQLLDLPDSATVAQAIDHALADLRALERRLRAVEADLEIAAAQEDTLADRLAAYAELTARFEARGGYRADRRVDVALSALGLPGLDRTRPLGTLSGGERSRLALAGTLAAAPELLLLDEPTNDLDDAAVEWLERHLWAHRGTVVAVTHDRVFLERITATVLEVDAGRITRHGNGYAGYLAAKAAERRRQRLEFEQWCDELARNRRLAESNVARLEAIPRKLPLAVFGHGSFRTRGRGHGAVVRIRNAKERVSRLTAEPVAPPPVPLRFTARPPRADDTGDGPVVCLSDIAVGDRLRVGELRLHQGDRLLVTGPNGAGKTTLMRLLAGELRPDAGTATVRGRVGHLRQQQIPWPAARTVLDAYADGRAGCPDEYAEELLSLGLFRPGELGLRIGELSYGQRRRIELARLVSEPTDLLLLDEPTNHLAPALVEQLEQALAGYTGALVVVTHDRRLRATLPGPRLEVRGGVVQSGFCMT
ncbi:TlrC/CarA/OleB/SrmB family ABC-F type ribosomal protection protein [Nocardia blacklockiae]|uniref:TlrC/CarA/OleB/SrmB family ABC-F type ribosomal protection protein n=1 Tax=Nocardia blacklockiae TaxID=480036 RepID=UPI0018953DF7|nr:TlrC/CarA/OleB/SrmB family ABC-F type ribosomal protection protein [Nocardia blacklockiae]MBF6175140.1 TlrC/CarA/OleB/SrmB family ABC-F type ribosomal protection protein [Nocardia blacklockiae]